MKKVVLKILFKGKEKQENKKAIIRKGFSLIEVLFAIVVLSIGIVSVLIIMGTNIKTSILAKNQIIAAQLVQEGIELVRNLNDNEDPRLVAGTNYDGYRVNFDTASTSIDFVSSADYRLNLVGDSYSHSNGEATRFSRKIDISDDGEQRIITSTVVWNSEGDFPAIADCNILNECATANSVISY